MIGTSVMKELKIIEITSRHGCSPANLLNIFRTPFTEKTSGKMLLTNNHESKIRTTLCISPYAFSEKPVAFNLLRRNSLLTVPKNLRRCFRVMTNKSSIKAFYSTVTEIGQAEIFVMIIQKRNWYLYKILFLARKHFSGNRQLLRHKKWSFPFRTSLIKVNKSSENGGFLTSSK